MAIPLPPSLHKVILFAIVALSTPIIGSAQLLYQPYSYQFYQKLNGDFYSPSNNLHTSLKPFVINDSSAVRSTYLGILDREVDTSHKSWAYRKLFNEHLFDVKNNEFTFYFDYLPDLMIGKEFIAHNSTWLNTRGYQAGGTIGKRFFFYTSGFENQGKFPTYLNQYVVKTGIVPGQAFDFNGGIGTKDWAYVTTLLGYAPTNGFMIEGGIDKTFIGDGYRSILLSDFAQNYPLLRVKINIGKRIQYMAMWAYLQDRFAQQFDPSGLHPPNRAKWAAFHYIDWNITNRASLGFFNGLVAPDAYDDGTRHGFDANYVNPIFFSKSLAPSGPIPDNTLIGFNGKYKVLEKTTIYGQFIYDQSSSTVNTKDGFQLGVRGSDIFKIHSFNYLFEYNTVKPYTYSTQYPLVNYTELEEPLAHPFGANFKEIVGILNYSIGRFDFQGQVNYAKYGLDVNNINYGDNLLLADNIPQGSDTGQGLSTTFKYAQGTIAFVINPKYNLRIEAGAVLRQESNSQTDNKTVLISFGLRSSFRNLYTDF
ncbi:MAG: hypothetical protein JWP37_3766 [Mucilaginibacter sp.]|nr:hypothetical protein [Mucilaginibacter sp.]